MGFIFVIMVVVTLIAIEVQLRRLNKTNEKIVELLEEKGKD